MFSRRHLLTSGGGAWRTVAATGVLTVVVAGVALAAHPVKGATYHGAIATGGPIAYPISFKVSANGNRVGSFVFGTLPVHCQGGGFGSPQPASAPVTKKGSFKATVTLYFAPAHATTGKLIVTGSFLKHGKERGTISSKFAHSTSCDKTDSYSTTG